MTVPSSIRPVMGYNVLYFQNEPPFVTKLIQAWELENFIHTPSIKIGCES